MRNAPTTRQKIILSLSLFFFEPISDCGLEKEVNYLTKFIIEREKINARFFYLLKTHPKTKKHRNAAFFRALLYSGKANLEKSKWVSKMCPTGHIHFELPLKAYTRFNQKKQGYFILCFLYPLVNFPNFLVS